MPQVLINNWVTLEHVGLASLSGAETIFNYKSSTMNISNTQMLQFLSDWQTRFKPLIQACQSTQCQLLRTVGKTRFANEANTDAELDYPTNTFGSFTGDPSPNNVALSVKLLTGRSGRKYRGRQYMFGISESSTTTNFAGSILLANVSILFVQYLLGITSSSITYIGACASRTGGFITPYTSFSVDSRLDTQRRRMPRLAEFA